MVGRTGKVTNWQDDAIGNIALDERNAQWGEIPGKIVSFNASNQTATIKPLYKPKHNGKAIDMPDLLEVPVRFVRAGGGAVTHPIKAGDHVTLRPGMRSSENYLTDGDGTFSDARSFSLADMEAHLDGGESLNNPIPNFDSSNTHIRFDEEGNYGIKGNGSGQFNIVGSQGDIMDLAMQTASLVEQMNEKLSQEPALVFRSDYASMKNLAKEIKDKLSGMTI
jgi:hypothetical protein